MNIFFIILSGLVFCGLIIVPGSFWWWLAGLFLFSFEWFRRIPDRGEKMLGRAIIIFGLVVPLVFSKPARLFLGLGLLALLMALKNHRLSRFIDRQTTRRLIALALCAYSTLIFFSLVMHGTTWLWLGWGGALATYFFFMPDSLGAGQTPLSWLERLILTLCLGQSTLLIYFLPLRLSVLVSLFLLSCIWLLGEARESRQTVWSWQNAFWRFILLLAGTGGLFLISRV